MAAHQTYFDTFHSRITLEDDDEKANLREKRETLVDDLRARLDEDVPPFTWFNQGSYSMHTGTRPADGNYDIDVGLIFDCQKDDYPNPVDLKRKVHDALNHGNRTVVIRRPCVTVNYLRDEEVQYHVDLAIYVKRGDENLDLAKGKEFSDEDNRSWEVSAPRTLTGLICDRFTEATDRAQYRRSIRYLKRWRDHQFFPNEAPLSVALTVAAYKWFQPHRNDSGTYLDLRALHTWVNKLRDHFTSTWKDGALVSRLTVALPVEPGNDLFGWMTTAQMDRFKTRLDSLANALEDAWNNDLPEEACAILAKQFGGDFPVPAKEDTARKVAAPYVNTGSSS